MNLRRQKSQCEKARVFDIRALGAGPEGEGGARGGDGLRHAMAGPYCMSLL